MLYKGLSKTTICKERLEKFNGEWNFIFDDNDEGETKKYFKDFPTNRKINISKE